MCHSRAHGSDCSHDQRTMTYMTDSVATADCGAKLVRGTTLHLVTRGVTQLHSLVLHLFSQLQQALSSVSVCDHKGTFGSLLHPRRFPGLPCAVRINSAHQPPGTHAHHLSITYLSTCLMTNLHLHPPARRSAHHSLCQSMV